MIKAIIFDLDGVLITTRFFSERFEEKYNIPVAKFLPVLRKILAKATLTNSFDSFIYWEPYLKEWGVDLSREDFFDSWFQDEKLAPEMAKLINKIKSKKLKTFILSDNFKERTDYLEKKFPILVKNIGKRYYSWQTGLLKPDSRAYQQILKENNLDSQECLYFDDEKDNVEAANKLGIKSFIFKEAKETREILIKNKVI